MNGFANAVLTLLLGWLRSLFNAIWALLSNDGGSMVTLLCNHWQVIFLVLCVGGFVIDRVVYLIRWRPYYVWGSKRRANTRQRNAPEYADRYAAPPAYEPPQEDAAPYPEHYGEPSDENTVRYPPAGTPGFAPAYRYQAASANGYVSEATQAYRPPSPYAYQEAVPPQDPYVPQPPEESFAPTIAYDAVPYRATVAPEPMAAEPRFDDDFQPWSGQPQKDRSFAPQIAPEPAAIAYDEPHSGRDRYLKDVQSGFAPPLPPEELYSPRMESAGNGQVHPGLDPYTLQQNIGLGSEPDDELRGAYTDFAPFSATAQPAGDAAPRPRVLGTLAKKARTFVSGEDESNPLSIHDLQPTVDVSNAFHAPVYPKRKPESEE